jgi:hypothetical protein
LCFLLPPPARTGGWITLIWRAGGFTKVLFVVAPNFLSPLLILFIDLEIDLGSALARELIKLLFAFNEVEGGKYEL